MLHFHAAFALVTCVSVAYAGPDVFTSKSFESAKSQAAAEGKILLVDATASWCPPCRQMERETWTDPAVKTWLAANAVAFQFDVDRDSQLSRRLDIRSMPTLIIFKDGKETRRSTGYLSPAGILRWLKGGRASSDTAHLRNSIKQLRATMDARSTSMQQAAPAEAKVDIQVRLEQARNLGQTDPAAAAHQYQWLWDNMLRHNPAMHTVRLTFMANEMRRLAAKSPPALATFTTLRDAAESKLNIREGRSLAIADWLTLNRVVGDDARSLSWFDGIKLDASRHPDLRANEVDIRRLLEDAGRWADLGRLYAEPTKHAQRVIERAKDTLRYARTSDLKEATQHSQESTRKALSITYAALLAADRDDEADQVAKTLIEFSDTPESRRALVSRALQADEPREQQTEYLNQADAAATAPDQALRDQLQTALSVPGKKAPQ
jgi:thiol-disulfide isomerase/thioredoxin